MKIFFTRLKLLKTVMYHRKRAAGMTNQTQKMPVINSKPLPIELLLIFRVGLDDNYSWALLVLRFLLHLFDTAGGYDELFLEKQPLADDHVFDLTLLIP